jgi:hypothetical protein
MLVQMAAAVAATVMAAAMVQPVRMAPRQVLAHTRAHGTEAHVCVTNKKWRQRSNMPVACRCRVFACACRFQFAASRFLAKGWLWG